MRLNKEIEGGRVSGLSIGVKREGRLRVWSLLKRSYASHFGGEGNY